jgi:hypothetical protein
VIEHLGQLPHLTLFAPGRSAHRASRSAVRD